MKRLLLVIFAIACAATAYAVEYANVIVPRPLSCEAIEGSFALTPKTTIRATLPSLVPTGEVFAADLEVVLGNKLVVKKSSAKKGAINLALNSALASEEYTLKITADGVWITGGSERAVFYGLQSLRQIVAASDITAAGTKISAVNIADKPHFAYRGGMLDVCRHIFTVDEVKRYIDILALHKINKFHWHLTEDQGWRIEIKRYPELSEVGAYRNQTLIGRNRKSKLYDGTRYGGVFTQDEVREVVAYASARYIDIIPEIEMPGHAVAALTTYPHLGCTGGPYEVWTRWGISENIFCAGKESTFEFIENVLTEVLELFPYKYIHIGGDEAPRAMWKQCPHCQKRIKDEGLRDEHQLQSYFMERVERWLNERGRSIIGWDEILQGGISKSATVMSWRGTKGGIAAAKLGNDVIMAPNTYCYIDYYQTSDPAANGEPLANGRRPVTLAKNYSLDPYAGLDEHQQKFIKGVQVNLWTEYVSTFDHVQHMLLPRLAALAETGWSYGNKDYADFSRRMHILRKLYDKQGFVYAPYFFNGIE
ncbi:MAG: beta-N-acetylhexosaminidase [Alistipes sp.]|nr:beta-N-acetylhexosaminidase [Alistipes sp.]